ncbi:hypothetical protein [Lentilactobacillus kefiri]|uniref:hypothetical protein n=1 Tax=Lentilactobacillus kefiri TaxID=33962 RepID=UPI000BA4EBC0|nr:hypothetical protein [Lentilactobacillus kefiri]PAK82460.1 hypothetical protein B8W85_08135 [Lentilactobacillus kefiri]
MKKDKNNFDDKKYETNYIGRKNEHISITTTFSIPIFYLFKDYCRQHKLKMAAVLDHLIKDYLKRAGYDLSHQTLEIGWCLFYQEQFKKAVNRLYKKRQLDDFGKRIDQSLKELKNDQASILIADAIQKFKLVPQNFRDERIMNYYYDLERAAKVFKYNFKG